MSRLLDYLKKNNLKIDSELDSATIAYLSSLDYLEKAAPKVAESIIDELRDQRSNLKLIASENFSSYAVQLAMGNWLTDKYAEGIAGRRFYAGCEHIDKIEVMAQHSLCEAFGADHAYVQPHSGADANLVAFWSILLHRIENPNIERLGKKSLDELTATEYEEIRQLLVGQKLMGLDLLAGGHLTHGYRRNVSSKFFQAISYGVDPQTELINYAHLAQQVKKERPLILLAGYSAYPRKINFAKMREIADSVNAVLMVDMAHFAGLVAGKVFTGEENPIPYADLVTSTTHKTLRGPRGGFILCKKEFVETVDKGCPLVLGGPLPHVLAAKAIAFEEIRQPSFQLYAEKIVENSQWLAQCFVEQGIRLVTGGTDNHLLLLDLSSLGLTGRQAENALRQAKITVNRNAIPFDPAGPWYTSGIRLGTPALTSLGMGKDEMKEIAQIISSVLSNTTPISHPTTGIASRATVKIDEEVLEGAKNRVKALLFRYPLYPEIAIS